MEMVQTILLLDSNILWRRWELKNVKRCEKIFDKTTIQPSAVFWLTRYDKRA